MRRLAWKAEISDLGDSLEPAELAPDSRHLFKSASPELLVETLKRKGSQRWPNRRFEIVAESPLYGRGLCPFNLGQLTFDLLATRKVTETRAIDWKRYDWIFRSEPSPLIDLSLFEIHKSFQERKNILRAPENADYPRPVLIGKTLLCVQCPKHPPWNLALLEQCYASIELLAQQPSSAGTCESGADDDDFQVSYLPYPGLGATR
jgi:hypothetical protein